MYFGCYQQAIIKMSSCKTIRPESVKEETQIKNTISQGTQQIITITTLGTFLPVKLNRRLQLTCLSSSSSHSCSDIKGEVYEEHRLDCCVCGIKQKQPLCRKRESANQCKSNGKYKRRQFKVNSAAALLFTPILLCTLLRKHTSL